MFKMSRVYILAEILYLGKNEGKLGTLFTIMAWQINDLVPTYFFMKIYYEGLDGGGGRGGSGIHYSLKI